MPADLHPPTGEPGLTWDPELSKWVPAYRQARWDPTAAEATASNALDQPGTGAGYTAVRPAHPAWLLDLVYAAETAADETACNGDHEGNDGCDGCAWAGLVEAVPVRIRNAADERASKGGAW